MARMRGPLAGMVFLFLFAGALETAAGGGTSAREEGIALFKERRYEEAKGRLAEAVKEAPSDAEARAYLGMALHHFDFDLDGALAQLEEAARLEPGRAQYQLWLGMVYGEKAGRVGIFKAAHYAGKCKSAFEKAVELDPKDPAARESLIQFYLHAPSIAGGSLQKAKEQAEVLRRVDRCRGLVAQGAIAGREGDRRRAEGLYREALAACPDRSLPYNALGYFLLEEKRPAEAVEVFRANVAAVPRDPNAHDSLGEALLAQGRVREAAAEYGRALEMNGYFSPSWLGLARCRELEGRRAEACAALRRYLALEPAGPRAEKARKRLAELEKRDPLPQEMERGHREGAR